MAGSDLRKLQSELRSTLERNHPELDPPFEFRIALYPTYDELFQASLSEMKGPSSTKEEIDAMSLIDIAFRSGRVIVHAPGGSGKTVLTWRLARRMLLEEGLAFVVELSEWTKQGYEEWNRYEGPAARLDYLLRGAAIPRSSKLALDNLVTVRKLFCFDGINEIEARTAQEVIELADEIAMRVPRSGVILTDRLARRHLPNSESWRLAVLRPLDDAQVNQLQASAKRKGVDTVLSIPNDLLRIPYYLDAFLKGDIGASTTAVEEKWFLRHASLSPEELDRTGCAAFQLYEENGTRTFSLDRLRQLVGEQVLHKLEEAKAINLASGSAYFVHHLKHDFLAARHLSSDSQLWTERNFNVVTFYASSFDVLVMTTELLDSPTAADTFIRRIYDWNYFGAAYVAAKNCRGPRRLVTPEMEIILLFMLADKLSDVVQATVERAKDGLVLFETPLSRRLLAISDRRELLGVLKLFNSSDDRFQTWREIFEKPDGFEPSESEIAQIDDANGIIGWTMANVLKRAHLTDAQLAELRTRLESNAPVIRWRAAHVLGAFPRDANARALLDIFDTELRRDPKSWVAYGALRSLVEMSVISNPEVRQHIFLSLSERAASIAGQDRLKEELERAVFVNRSQAPQGWIDTVNALLRTMRQHEKNIEGWDHWERVAYAIKNEYGPSAD